MFLVERKNTGDTILQCNDDTRAIRRNFSRVNPFFQIMKTFSLRVKRSYRSIIELVEFYLSLIIPFHRNYFPSLIENLF